MHIIRRVAKQGHYVPDHSYMPRGPFNPELFAREPVKYPDEQPFDDEPDLYLCRVCEAVLEAHELDAHECGEGEQY